MTTTATDTEVEARVRAAILAFDYSLRRWRQELVAEWRTPGLSSMPHPTAPIDYALDRLSRTLEAIAADAGRVDL